MRRFWVLPAREGEFTGFLDGSGSFLDGSGNVRCRTAQSGQLRVQGASRGCGGNVAPIQRKLEVVHGLDGEECSTVMVGGDSGEFRLGVAGRVSWRRGGE